MPDRSLPDSTKSGEPHRCEDWSGDPDVGTHECVICNHRAPLNYDRTRHATCALPAGHGGRHRQGDLAWTDRTMPCREAGRC